MHFDPGPLTLPAKRTGNDRPAGRFLSKKMITRST